LSSRAGLPAPTAGLGRLPPPARLRGAASAGLWRPRPADDGHDPPAALGFI